MTSLLDEKLMTVLDELQKRIQVGDIKNNLLQELPYIVGCNNNCSGECEICLDNCQGECWGY